MFVISAQNEVKDYYQEFEKQNNIKRKNALYLLVGLAIPYMPLTATFILFQLLKERMNLKDDYQKGEVLITQKYRILLDILENQNLLLGLKTLYLANKNQPLNLDDDKKIALKDDAIIALKVIYACLYGGNDPQEFYALDKKVQAISIALLQHELGVTTSNFPTLINLAKKELIDHPTTLTRISPK